VKVFKSHIPLHWPVPVGWRWQTPKTCCVDARLDLDLSLATLNGDTQEIGQCCTGADETSGGVCSVHGVSSLPGRSGKARCECSSSSIPSRLPPSRGKSSTRELVQRSITHVSHTIAFSPSAARRHGRFGPSSSNFGTPHHLKHPRVHHDHGPFPSFFPAFSPSSLLPLRRRPLRPRPMPAPKRLVAGRCRKLRAG
jgi:hypothetical protein